MTNPTLDVLCIGNAIVDVITDADDAFLVGQGLDKGSMRLIDEAEAVRLYGVMGPGREVSGGWPRSASRPASSARSPTTSWARSTSMTSRRRGSTSSSPRAATSAPPRAA